jgi:hypothetical protein
MLRLKGSPFRVHTAPRTDVVRPPAIRFNLEPSETVGPERSAEPLNPEPLAQLLDGFGQRGHDFK